MNTFELSRNFCNWAFENPEKVHPNHYAIYFFAIEHCNRLGGKDKFGFPSQMTMEAIGIKKHQTYIKYFNDLIEFGFFKLIEKSKNQYSANIISITFAMPKKGKALDKAFIKHTAKQTESTGQSTGQSEDSIIKQETINNKQGIHIFKKSPYYNKNFYLSEISKTDFGVKNIDFGAYWYSMEDYSEQNGKKYKNWLATARSWIRKDIKEGKVKTKEVRRDWEW
jgi:hypothetical protein